MTSQEIKKMNPMDCAEWFLTEASPMEAAITLAHWLTTCDKAMGYHNIVQDFSSLQTDEQYLQYLKTSCENGHLAETVMQQASYNLERAGHPIDRGSIERQLDYKQKIGESLDRARAEVADKESDKPKIIQDFMK